MPHHPSLPPLPFGALKDCDNLWVEACLGGRDVLDLHHVSVFLCQVHTSYSFRRWYPPPHTDLFCTSTHHLTLVLWGYYSRGSQLWSQTRRVREGREIPIRGHPHNPPYTMHCGFFPRSPGQGKKLSRELVNVCLGHGGFQCVSEGESAGGGSEGGTSQVGKLYPSPLSPSPFLRLGIAGSCCCKKNIYTTITICLWRAILKKKNLKSLGRGENNPFLCFWSGF